MSLSADASVQSVPVRLADYRAPDFLIDEVDLEFDLGEEVTSVTSRLRIRRNPEAEEGAADLRLDGEELELMSLKLNGQPLGANRYQVSKDALTIPEVPDEFVLETVTRIYPRTNTDLSGLYQSGGNLTTQCEAEGFRRITFFLDRPDVMARYSTTIIADRKNFPILLSNGNPAGYGEMGDGRHWVKWRDPHPKPSYLFALVAGDLVAVRDSFTTRSGRLVDLAIFVRHGDEDKCDHAMESLKASMKWDEDVFGFEYDLDVFNIVAVSDFNMGAMENKGLNIFNAKFVLAKPETATDLDYQAIEAVIGHEYFHNWTGNRITCRDWFQLSLKEGLTVFRDQEFSADRGSRAVKRITDVRNLRARQFTEDGGPLAHNVLPASYLEIGNIYTATIYIKGAELVRMIHTLLGPEHFRKGMDLYVLRHDNCAVTIDDFISAMQDASGVDLARFKRWYVQAGTPEIEIDEAFDEAAKSYVLTVRQRTPATPGQPTKEPVLIPLAMGLLDAEGRELPTQLDGETAGRPGTRILQVDEVEQVFRFVGLDAMPVPSLLRDFSAPVKLTGIPPQRSKFLAIYDTNPFARWEAGQQVATQLLLNMISVKQLGESPRLDPDLVAAFRTALANSAGDQAFAAQALTLPTESFLADQMDVVDVEAIHACREFVRAEIGKALRSEFLSIYESLFCAGTYRPDAVSIGRRALRNICLSYIAAADGDPALAKVQFDAGTNMTDVLAALTILADFDGVQRTDALAAFYDRWRGEELVLDKWFSIQAMSALPDTLAEVRKLLTHPDFDSRNPNRARSLIDAFAANNPLRFHDRSGAAYRFLAEQVMAIDPANGALASRLVVPLCGWRRQDTIRGALMKQELARIMMLPNLSKATYEQVSRSLG